MTDTTFSSPSAASLASELGLDPDNLTGTGRGGSITLADVRSAAPSIPNGLEDAGRELWLSINNADWDLDPRELAILERACRQADDVARCEEIVKSDGARAVGSADQPIVSPYLTEARQGRSTLKRLLDSLDLPTEDHDPNQRANAGRSLARQRWSRRG